MNVSLLELQQPVTTPHRQPRPPRVSSSLSSPEESPVMGSTRKIFRPKQTTNGPSPPSSASKPPKPSPVRREHSNSSLLDPTPEHLPPVLSDADLSNLHLEEEVEVRLLTPEDKRRHASKKKGSSLNGYLEQHQQQQHQHGSSSVASQASSKHSTGTSTTSGGAFFWRNNKKVSATDVASVGNASDTLVSVSSRIHCSGRDLHESAKLSLNAGEFQKALSMFEAILSAQVKRFGPLHASVGAAMHNVGVCRQRMGHYKIAESLLLEAVQIRQETLGPEHLEVAASLSKLGQARCLLHQFEEAFANLRQAQSIARRQLGPRHKFLAQILCHTACLYFEAGELLAAQATFEDAVAIYRAIWSSQVDRDVCMMQMTDTLCNIGSIQNRRKRFDGAIESFQEALDLQRGIYGHDHPRVVATLDNLGFSYSKTRDYARALACYKKMLRSQISYTATFSEECLETLLKMKIMYEKLKQIPEAIKDFKETLRLEKSMLPRDSPIIAQTKKILEELSKRKPSTNAAAI